MDVVAAIEAQQKTHPPLAGLPLAAQILDDLPLFIGEARAAIDGEFLRERGIGAVVSLGTGNIAVKSSRVHCVDILDMEEELLLPFFHECIAFIRANLQENNTAVLVHCVYGQSRSAAICVAYLMATRRVSLRDAYDTVQRARPCVYINSGFLRQLELFERMDAVADIMGDTPAHAEFRTIMATKERSQVGTAEIRGVPQLTLPRRALHCRKCNCLLATTRNEVAHGTAKKARESNNVRVCGAFFVEPMQWMVESAGGGGGYGGFASVKEGKLACPSCKAKIGSWNWIGVKPGDTSPHDLHGRLIVLAGSSRETRSGNMGTTASSSVSSSEDTLVSVSAPGQPASSSSSPLPEALLLILGSISYEKLPHLLRATQRSFTLSLQQLRQLFNDDVNSSSAIETVLSIFDTAGRGQVDSWEVVASLILASPLLERRAKLRGSSCSAVSQIFNVSKYRVGQLISDEATMLLRAVAIGVFKILLLSVPVADSDLIATPHEYGKLDAVVAIATTCPAII